VALTITTEYIKVGNKEIPKNVQRFPNNTLIFFRKMTKPKKIPQTISIDPPEYILPHYQYDYSYDYVDYPYAYQSTGYWHPKVEDGNKKTKVSFPG
jgi:hypothetical protein